MGCTNNLTVRIKRHAFGGKSGSAWTRLHKPVDLYLVMDADENTEKEVTLDLMLIHGVDKVRGGPWIYTDKTKDYNVAALHGWEPKHVGKK